MTSDAMTLVPALALLGGLAALAWAVRWLRRRLPAGVGGGTALRVVSQLMLGPQQRIVVVELDGPGGPVQLTLGVTPQHVRTLHVRPLGAKAADPAAKAQPAAPEGLSHYAGAMRAALHSDRGAADARLKAAAAPPGTDAEAGDPR